MSIVSPAFLSIPRHRAFHCNLQHDLPYVGDSDWLLKETKYPFGGAAFDLVQYRYISPKLMRIVLRDGGACNTVIYLQLNWHGDFYRGYGTDGGIVNTLQGDEWGVWFNSPLACGAPHAYHWNAQWGYQFFGDLSAPNGTDPPLGLYYVHGRWYNPEVGLWLSPNEKGDYFYGGDGQDAANLMRVAAREFLGGVTYQVVKNNIDVVALPLYVNPPWRKSYEEIGQSIEANLPDTGAFRFGRVFGSAVTFIQGFSEISAAPDIAVGGTALSCLLGGEETLGAACLAGGATSVLVSGGVIVHGLSVEGVSLVNGSQQAMTFFAGRAGQEWRPLGYEDLPDSYVPPKGGPRQVRVQHGPYEGRYGWLDENGDIWVPTKPGESHGGPHWDVQINGGKGGYYNEWPRPK